VQPKARRDSHFGIPEDTFVVERWSERMSQSNKDSRYLILQTPSKEEYKITVHEGDVAILAKDLAQIKLKTSTNQEEKQITSFDPGFMNTACCESTITYIDGDKGILRYRGYPIEQLAEKSNFLEVSCVVMTAIN